MSCCSRPACLRRVARELVHRSLCGLDALDGGILDGLQHRQRLQRGE